LSIVRPTRPSQLAILLCVGLVFGSAGCGSTDSGMATADKAHNAYSGARTVSHQFRRKVNFRAVRWSVISIPRKNVVKLGATMGACSGSPEPRIARVDVKRDGHRAYITVIGRFVRLVSSRKFGNFCGGVLSNRYRTIRLSQPVADLRLYDGSTEPPVKRWPTPQ